MIASILAFAVIIVIFPKEIGATLSFYEETLSPYSAKNELVHRAQDYTYDETVKAFSYPGFWTGHGTGTTALGTQYVRRILGQAKPKYAVEAGWGDLVFADGYLGIGALAVLEQCSDGDDVGSRQTLEGNGVLPFRPLRSSTTPICYCFR